MSDETATCGSDTKEHRPFPLLRLPVEIQLQIYRFAWTTEPVEKLPSTYFLHDTGDFVDRVTDRNDLVQSELAKKVNEELSAVRTMGSVCRHIRTTVYDEYFSHTQAIVQVHEILFRKLPGNFPYFQYCIPDVWLELSDSTCVSEHIQHVCLVITEYHFLDRKHGWAGLDQLNWLTSLRNLTTLEVVFEQKPPGVNGLKLTSSWRKGLPGVKWARPMIRSLPYLKKLVFKLKWKHSYPQGNALVWEEYPWFLEIRQLFQENATVSEDPEQRCFKFKNHIGVTYHDWPCSYEI
ncbi:hypothetical protein B0T20DRAFT_353269 [Sordaria brevicollis]|uniref:Uncharacterized protein n=1 Tax=Sordaria brevicollis TaxID=83679 RepID=A0AAE0PFK2_SORBR|nr:hypothetical protein B0T20DRAFT_353269 [Sordaria brevicollis]